MKMMMAERGVCGNDDDDDYDGDDGDGDENAWK